MRRTTQASSRLLFGATLLLGSVLAQQDSSLSARIAGLAGTGLTHAQTQDRLQRLGTMLGDAGYGTARTGSLGDGTLASRWYSQSADRTVFAFSGQQAEDNALTVAEHAGLLRWNELMATP
ncbi:hypothetical protein [Deinococcus navajonensis]|uniref:Uncharacterized protein n=1 Tax=Deinococcus navajonensis TaxID=309884 RepID=A0ABV8XRP5_9DEIO